MKKKAENLESGDVFKAWLSKDMSPFLFTKDEVRGDEKLYIEALLTFVESKKLINEKLSISTLELRELKVYEDDEFEVL